MSQSDQIEQTQQAEQTPPAATADQEHMIAEIYEALHNVYDPELGVNIVDLGLVYNVDLREDGFVTITMTLTTPGCPLHDSLTAAVDEAVRVFVPSVEDVAVNLVWEPAWSPEMITEAGRDELGWWG